MRECTLVDAITVLKTFTKLNDNVNKCGGSDEIWCYEIKSQLKQSVEQREIFPN